MLAFQFLLLLFDLVEAQQYRSCADGGVGHCRTYTGDDSCPYVPHVTVLRISDSFRTNRRPFSACVDLVNPRTGVSDCPNLAYLCNNAIYYNLMTQQCPKTCNRSCFDLVNPRTGVSDCPRLAYLCNNVNYYNLMTQQCPRTCNRCPPGAATVVTPTVVPATTCQDLVDPRTGVSNCAQMAAYCRNPLYVNLMRQQCPRTCGYCV
ncbi:unnamed protein product [Heligmosomoides polygyrus]|uniref:ShTK domain protein n=1 Tax=Heligmosomoides polygyrus TaxID=6339 RepID=A0A183F5F4_HELPZ|nr:unnamed protein product [Heligmosomoides polygyrus]